MVKNLFAPKKHCFHHIGLQIFVKIKQTIKRISLGEIFYKTISQKLESVTSQLVVEYKISRRVIFSIILAKSFSNKRSFSAEYFNLITLLTMIAFAPDEGYIPKFFAHTY